MYKNLTAQPHLRWCALRSPLEIQICGMKCKSHGAQQPQSTSVHEDCEHRAAQQFARKMNL